ncbi:hypothetical protein HML84_09530 [Alcanivorax sp. IO_7]|nr:hypothetical protein HML84_09530 [Alcanivorax sp. IO_7]
MIPGAHPTQSGKAHHAFDQIRVAARGIIQIHTKYLTTQIAEVKIIGQAIEVQIHHRDTTRHPHFISLT